MQTYNLFNFNIELVDESLQNKSDFHMVENFSLINLNGETLTQEAHKN
jgi:protein SCO1/2